MRSHHYGGYVAQSTGEGIFALFGATVAHEDHPQRAYLQKLLRVRVVKPMENRKVVYQSTISARGGTEYLPRQGAGQGNKSRLSISALALSLNT